VNRPKVRAEIFDLANPSSGELYDKVLEVVRPVLGYRETKNFMQTYKGLLDGKVDDTKMLLFFDKYVELVLHPTVKKYFSTTRRRATRRKKVADDKT